MNKNKQIGLTIVSLLVMLIISFFIIITVVKVLPPYIENLSVNNSLVSIADEINLKKIKEKDIKSKLIKRLVFNNVTRVNEDHITISDGKDDNTTLNIKYEVRKPIIGNVDFILTFQNTEVINF